MSIELYDNLDPKKGQHLDSRLTVVANVAALPDLTDSSNFLYEGAVIYVTNQNVDYQAQFTTASPTVLVWVSQAVATLTQGNIVISASQTTLDLSLVSPSVETCSSVVISIGSQANPVSSLTATINSITNWPAGQEIKFYTALGQSITYTHVDYDAIGVGDIVSEDGQSVLITGRAVGNDSITLVDNGTAFVQSSATQFLKQSELQQNLLNIIVADNLTTQAGTTALSANQGYILKQLVDTKQDIITAGDHIDLNSNVIKALPWNWIKEDITGTTGILNRIDVYKQTNYGNTPQSNYIYLKKDESQRLLPPLLDPSIGNNWISLSDAATTVKVARYNLSFEIPNVTLNAVTGNYYPVLNISSSVGDAISLTFGGATGSNKFSFALQDLGLYKIEYKIHLNNTAVDLTLYRTSNITTEASPLSASPVQMEKAAGDTSISLSALQEVTVSDTNNAFVVEMTPTSSWGLTVGDFAAAPGYVEITKLR